MMSRTLLIGIVSFVAMSATEGGEATVVDLSVYDRQFSGDGAFGGLLVGEAATDCPSCIQKTPALNTPTELIIPGIMNPPSSPTASGIFIEFRLPSNEAGECKLAGSSSCSDKNCEFTLSYKISGSMGGSYGYDVQSTFPPSSPSSSSGSQPPNSSFVAEWDVSKACGEGSLY